MTTQSGQGQHGSRQAVPTRPRGRAAAIAAGALVVVVAAAGIRAWLQAGPRQTGNPAAAPPAPQPVPVFIYLIDTLRADHLQVYGYGKETSPNLAALATESVVFDQAYAAAPWTLPSVASLVTSTYACEHGVTAAALRLAPSLPTLAERMKRLGYATGAYYSNILAGPPSALDRGYDVSQWLNEDDVRADETRTFLDGIGDLPPFLYLHTMEPHQPYLADYRYIRLFGHVPIERKVQIDQYWRSLASLKHATATPREPSAQQETDLEISRIMAALDDMRDSYELLYDAAVREADDNIGDVIAVLKERNLWDRSLFIMLADHGEEFGEHGTWFHEESMFEAVTRVPLIIHFPRGEHAGTRVAETVSLVDVVPTILDYLGQRDQCETCRGSSLLGLVRGEPGRGDAPLVTGLRTNTTTYLRPVKERRGDVNVALRQGALKGIWNEEPRSLELYDLAGDPAETRDIAALGGAGVQLRSRAVQWLRECRGALKRPAETALDERTRERLRSLGYTN